MVKSIKPSLLLVLYVLMIVCALTPLSHCAKKPVGIARKEDIPYIKCQVCEKLASQIYHQVEAKRAEISPKKVSEYEIIEIAENVCNLKKREADWILKIDIVEKGNKLELVEQDSEGQCNSECKTIERACQEVLGYSDTDAAEYLFKKKPQLDALINFICKDLTGACSSKPPPVPKDRTPGEPFVAKSEKEAEMERLMKSMEGMPGAPGMKMYSREDLMNQNFGAGDGDDEDDDDADEFPSNLGKSLRQKAEKQKDWKERITKGVLNAGEKLKGHADRVSYKMRRWWQSKKTEWKKISSQSGKAEL
ncbi:nucleophosmin [Perilla frutescens var. hirtella]|nr:nucleophosmin [Perilla frutescens var. hirtella]